MTVHLDTDFIIRALSGAGGERRRLVEAVDVGERIEMSALAWYEFSRGPRTPNQLAVAKAFLADDGIVPLTDAIVETAAEVFRKLGSPRRRAADIAIGVTASYCNATLMTCNARDFIGIPNLDVEDGT